MEFIDRNTPELWDRLWNECHGSSLAIDYEERTVRCKRIRAALGPLGPVHTLRVIELGAGLGTYSAILARLGASVSLLDYSPEALKKSTELFATLGLRCDSIRANALDPPQGLLSSFDVAMSFGLAEHFTGGDRNTIIESHLRLLRPGGLAVISVPNRFNLPYRLYQVHATRHGSWPFGEEYPFSPSELRRVCRTAGAARTQILGDSCLSSLKFLGNLPALWRVPRLLSRSNWGRRCLAGEIGAPMDRLMAYAIVACARL